jgi:3-deoxy-D-manno-octulosonic-acid transferase
MFRRALTTFELIFVQNEESKRLLAEIGLDNVIVAGDTRFDRAAALPAQAMRFPLIEQFKGKDRLFIVGSSWRPDEDLLVPFVNAHPDVKFVIAPHEMEEPRIQRLITECTGGVVRYSECRAENDVERARVLIIDVIGILNQLYQYADWVYIGGGFGVCIHNTQEPATYGVPIAFGPKYHKFKEACDMIALGACRSVTTTEELEEWFAPLKADEKRRAHAARIAANYIASNKGATELIVRTIFSE